MHKLEPRPYQANPTLCPATYTNRQCQKIKEPYPWILQELDATQPKSSRPYYTEEPIIITLNATKQLPGPR